jgi:hypothetical protein
MKYLLEDIWLSASARVYLGYRPKWFWLMLERLGDKMFNFKRSDENE